MYVECGIWLRREQAFTDCPTRSNLESYGLGHKIRPDTQTDWDG